MVAFTAAGLVSAMMTALPASAASGVLLPTIGSGGAGAHHLQATCFPAAGATTNLNQMTYVIELAARAWSTNRSVPVGLSAQCFVYRVSNNHVYATVSGGAPGGEVEAVGVVTVPATAEVALCVKASTAFNDNATVAVDACPF
jgi:hypothetical protein